MKKIFSLTAISLLALTSLGGSAQARAFSVWQHTQGVTAVETANAEETEVKDLKDGGKEQDVAKGDGQIMAHPVSAGAFRSPAATR